jgi:DNA-binding NtrC family response regulator
MNAPKGLPLLVVTGEPALRREIEAALGETHPLHWIEPGALRADSRWIDQRAAIVGLAGSAPSALDALEPLRAAPAGRALALVARGVPEALLAEALERLAPRQLVVLPAPAAALRYAAARLEGEAGGGEGARAGQRPAQALLGVSAAIREVLEQVRQVAATGVPVLVLGETGTGKELVARALHEQSPRRDRPFVAVNCGSIPEPLLEAELFGFRRGAFTGATRDKLGLFEHAHGGTLLLDEIGDMPLGIQVKLLRALETGEVRPLGSNESKLVDVRIVSATHRDLEGSVAEGRFRSDLLYRLNTVTIAVPPLRRRRVDIPFLAQHFAEVFGAGQARRITLSEEFLESLADYDFPGNVRELRNSVERAIALSQSDEPIAAEALPAELRRIPRMLKIGTLRDRVLRLEHEAIRDALDRFDGNRTRAADSLGLSRLGLRQKMRRLGLE